MIEYPSFYFPPINLFSIPKQYRDYMTPVRNRVADRRVQSLKLVPTKPNRHPNSRIIIEPAIVDIDSRIVAGERMDLCKALSQRPGRRF